MRAQQLAEDHAGNANSAKVLPLECDSIAFHGPSVYQSRPLVVHLLQKGVYGLWISRTRDARVRREGGRGSLAHPMYQFIPSLTNQRFYADASVEKDVGHFGASRRLEEAVACKTGTGVPAQQLLVDQPQSCWIGYREDIALPIPPGPVK